MMNWEVASTGESSHSITWCTVIRVSSTHIIISSSASLMIGSSQLHKIYSSRVLLYLSVFFFLVLRLIPSSSKYISWAFLLAFVSSIRGYVEGAIPWLLSQWTEKKGFYPPNCVMENRQQSKDIHNPSNPDSHSRSQRITSGEGKV